MMKNFVLALLVVSVLPLASLAQDSDSGKTRISIPGVKGVLELNAGPTRVKTSVENDRKLARLDAMPRPDRLQVTAFLWQVGFPATADSCKDELWRSTMNQVQVTRENLQQNSNGQIARVEYMIPEYNGAPVQQKNVHEYLGSRDLCAEVRVSKILYRPQDQKLFDDVLNSVRLLPDEGGDAQQPDNKLFQGSKSYLFDGTMAYLDKDFPTATQQLQQALDMEKQKRTLGRDDFRILVDNLANSYRFTQNPAKSKEVLDYGLTQDTSYPLFHYDMACYWGGQGNMDNALSELRLAFKNQGHLSTSDQLSDPLQDNCFGKFLKNKKFTSAVQQMQGQ